MHLPGALYIEQQATVRTSHSLTDWFDVDQGVRQDCILSPHLFNIYSEKIMRDGLAGCNKTVKVEGRSINKLRYRYADDVVLIASSMQELQLLVDQVNDHSKNAGLFLNTN